MNQTSRYVALGAFALTLAGHALAASAQVLRDPTVAPGVADAPAGGSPAGLDGMSVIVRDGRPFLVVGTRLYGPGDRFGSARVVRISETEVVLLEGNERVRVPRFAGIERKTVVDPVHCTPVKPVKPAKRTSAPTPAVGASSAALAGRPVPIKPSREHARPKSSPAAGAPCEDRPS